MRVAFLAKRRYMRHDVIDERYARLYALPSNLALLGHDVLGVCLSYYSAEQGYWLHQTTPGRLEWVSRNAGSLCLPGILRHVRHAQRWLTDFNPDVIIGASDALHVILARLFGRRLNRPYVVDLYDNFESFGLTRIPFLRGMYRRAVREAAVVTCVSEPLANLIVTEYAPRGRIATLESTIAGDDFSPLKRQYCRDELGLPRDAQLIGTAGALDDSRGIRRLFEAFEMLSAENDRVHLVLAGTIGGLARLPPGPRVHFLGQLPHARVPLLYGALDVGVICLRDTTFGRYSFPQKAHEMAAMRIPLVIAAVGAMATLFRDYTECLYDPGSSHDLAQKITRQLTSPVIPDVPIPTWSEQARHLGQLLHEATRR